MSGTTNGDPFALTPGESGPLSPEVIAALPHDNAATRLNVSIRFLVGLAAIFLCLRVYCKFLRMRKLWWDDAILIASFVRAFPHIHLSPFLSSLVSNHGLGLSATISGTASLSPSQDSARIDKTKPSTARPSGFHIRRILSHIAGLREAHVGLRHRQAARLCPRHHRSRHPGGHRRHLVQDELLLHQSALDRWLDELARHIHHCLHQCLYGRQRHLPLGRLQATAEGMESLDTRRVHAGYGYHTLQYLHRL